jgi:uncharacterized protein YndB with AHSA1/START domain
MASEIISFKTKLNAPGEVVWKALTTATQMKNWYFAMERFIAEPGYTFKMFGKKENKYFPINCVIISVQKNKQLSYSWSYEEFPAETIVNFELIEMGQQTILKLTHTGLEQIPASFTELSIANHAIGWKHIIAKSLKEFVEIKK